MEEFLKILMFFMALPFCITGAAIGIALFAIISLLPFVLVVTAIRYIVRKFT